MKGNLRWERFGKWKDRSIRRRGELGGGGIGGVEAAKGFRLKNKIKNQKEKEKTVTEDRTSETDDLFLEGARGE